MSLSLLLEEFTVKSQNRKMGIASGFMNAGTK
jgi:hypothetical protein